MDANDSSTGVLMASVGVPYVVGNLVGKQEVKLVEAIQPAPSGLPSDLRTRFRALVEVWYRDTAQSSDPKELISHPAYLRIIGLGDKVLPLLFDELQTKPHLWFAALEALTGDDPVPDTARSTKAVREAWLEYGRRNGYIR